MKPDEDNPTPPDETTLGCLGALGRNADRDADEHEDQRRAGRVQVEGVACNLGEIVDLSATGIQVTRKTSRPPERGDVIELILSGSGMGIRIEAEVVRIRKIARKQWAIHMHFIENNEARRKMLSALAFENRRGQTTL